MALKAYCLGLMVWSGKPEAYEIRGTRLYNDSVILARGQRFAKGSLAEWLVSSQLPRRRPTASGTFPKSDEK